MLCALHLVERDVLVQFRVDPVEGQLLRRSTSDRLLVPRRSAARRSSSAAPGDSSS